jgi:hypothetical protein
LRPIKKKPQKALDIIIDTADDSHIDSTKDQFLETSTTEKSIEKTSSPYVSDHEMDLVTPGKKSKTVKTIEKSVLPEQSIETASKPAPEINPQQPSETAAKTSENADTTIMFIDNTGQVNPDVDCEVCGQPGANVKCVAPDCNSYIHSGCSVTDTKILCSIPCKKVYFNE